MVSKVSVLITKSGDSDFHGIQSWSKDINGYSSDRLRMTCSMNGCQNKATFRDKYRRGMTG